MSAASDAAKAVVLQHFDALNSGDYGGLEQLHHPAARNHAGAAFAPELPEEGTPFGPDDVRATFQWLRSGFSDLTVDVLDLIAEGDRVAARIRMRGTHDGDFAGLAPTGRRWAYEHVHIFRTVDGMITEHWAVRDDLKAMLQLGVVAPPG